jgi:hypothetical protein
VGLATGLRVGLATGLRVGLATGLLASFATGLRVGLATGLRVGLAAGLRVGFFGRSVGAGENVWSGGNTISSVVSGWAWQANDEESSLRQEAGGFLERVQMPCRIKLLKAETCVYAAGKFMIPHPSP